MQYTRKDVFNVIGIDDPGGGGWYTGYTAHGDDHFIFCGVGTSGRTGHDYKNRFVGDELIWYGKSQSRLNQPSIQSLLKPKGHVYLFFREDNRDPFTFAGLAYPKNYSDSAPVQITWVFGGTNYSRPEISPQEIDDPAERVTEGAKKTVTVNVYERDPNARRRCVEYWGLQCAVCDFDFEQTYGELGKGFIHVHHLKPLGEVGDEYELDPIQDLRPVCPNCHAMLHRKKPALSISELQELIGKKSHYLARAYN
jgi:predicted restriction endonuclease